MWTEKRGDAREALRQLYRLDLPASTVPFDKNVVNDLLCESLRLKEDYWVVASLCRNFGQIETEM
jgi:hypothetical protein